MSGEQNQQQQNGNDSGNGSGSGLEGLLDTPIDDAGNGGSEGGDQGGANGGSGQSVFSTEQLTELGNLIGAETQKVSDRLVGAQGKQFRKVLEEAGLIQKPGSQNNQQSGNGGNGSDGQNQQQQPGNQQQQPVVYGGIDKNLLRGAKSTAREALGDAVKFHGLEERELAMALVDAHVRGAVIDGDDDEDQIGLSAASSVAGTIGKLRKFYESRTVAALRARGALKEQPGQQAPGGSSAGPESDFAAGAKVAAERFGTPGDGKQ